MNYKKYFPIFGRWPKLVYLDSAATSQKPQAVINRLTQFYLAENANIKRGLYPLAEAATKNFDQARQTVADFIGAQVGEIVFTKNTTEAFNLIALTYGKSQLQPGDEILLTQAEHHSNLVPWQRIAQERGYRLKYLKIDQENGRLDLENFQDQISQKTKIFSITHASNVTGAINDLADIVRLFRQSGKGIVVGDLAQSAPHLPIKVKELDLDFAAFSSHKMYGPLGIGVLYAKADLLKVLPPFLTGGGVVESVSQFSTKYLSGAERFEAGTQDIGGVLAFAEAIKFITHLSWSKIIDHETQLTDYALKKLLKIPEVIIYGPKDCQNRIGVIAFNLSAIHSHDVAQSLADLGIAIRAGHHCAMPLHKEVFKVPASCRISLGLYNTEEDIDQLIKGLKKTIAMFKRS